MGKKREKASGEENSDANHGSHKVGKSLRNSQERTRRPNHQSKSSPGNPSAGSQNQQSSLNRQYRKLNEEKQLDDLNKQNLLEERQPYQYYHIYRPPKGSKAQEFDSQKAEVGSNASSVGCEQHENQYLVISQEPSGKGIEQNSCPQKVQNDQGFPKNPDCEDETHKRPQDPFDRQGQKAQGVSIQEQKPQTLVNEKKDGRQSQEEPKIEGMQSVEFKELQFEKPERVREKVEQ